MNRQIVYNAIKCLNCQETVVSHHVHDYKHCKCGLTAVDGGNQYTRYGGENFEKITIYADDDFSIVRKVATRGSRGPNGDQPLSWIAICDMDDDYLQAVLDYGGPEWHLELIKKEIEWRQSEQVN